MNNIHNGGEILERPQLAGGAVLAVQVGDVVRLKKSHPCGSADWLVRRVGADIGLICRGCGRRIMLPRSSLARRIRFFLRPAVAAAPADAAETGTQ